jgi:hypothetical protein
MTRFDRPIKDAIEAAKPDRLISMVVPLLLCADRL